MAYIIFVFMEILLTMRKTVNNQISILQEVICLMKKNTKGKGTRDERPVFKGMVRKGLSEEVTLEQRPK